MCNEKKEPDRIRMVNVADTGWMELTPRLAADLKKSKSKTARYGWLVEDDTSHVLERALNGRPLCMERLAPCLEAECPNHGACIDVVVEEKDVNPEVAADIAGRIKEELMDAPGMLDTWANLARQLDPPCACTDSTLCERTTKCGRG